MSAYQAIPPTISNATSPSTGATHRGRLRSAGTATGVPSNRSRALGSSGPSGVYADVRARAKAVLWLNPEPRASWAFGDSAMRSYEPHCDRVEVVNNLASLKRVVDRIVL